MQRKFWDSSRCPLIQGVPLMWGPLNTGFTVAILKLLRKQPCGTGYSSTKHCTCPVKKILCRLRFRERILCCFFFLYYLTKVSNRRISIQYDFYLAPRLGKIKQKKPRMNTHFLLLYSPWSQARILINRNRPIFVNLNIFVLLFSIC